ncbi:hypothetical protein [Sinorhizobium americanum]|uniref:SIR2-like domain-containing protein n=1 Tax=Sinorhizobium americanum TaxID=194963 RepID=A0A4R2BZG0_9HYPH|nr:hypothetical protein [Sinorhizobium americanum]TCN32472.1 hypothetical protein EV184_104138 [Sinorhizobium americanum]
MFKDNTVFVIGAGASAEFNLPVGSGLMERIKQNCKYRFDYGSLKEGVPEIAHDLIERYRDQQSELDARFMAMGEVHRSIDLAGSIDEFINRHYDDPIIAEVGKLQIAYAIAKAEKDSLLARPNNGDETFRWDKLNDTWIRTFAQLLFEGVRNGEAERIGNNISIICFNYDRCIEHYLTEAIVKTFRGIDRKEAGKIVDQINIIHPYGSLGKLAAHRFGGDVTSQRLRAMSESIVTWSESIMSDKRAAIEEVMLDASTLVFLGFAFAPQNMNLLSVDGMRDDFDSLEIYATGYGYDNVIDGRLKSKISNLYSSGPGVVTDRLIHVQYEMKCAKFMQSHSMALVA